MRGNAAVGFPGRAMLPDKVHPLANSQLAVELRFQPYLREVAQRQMALA